MKKIGFRDVKLVAYDFDGVMTNNRVILREDGMESVVVNRSDGLAVEMLKKMHIDQVIITKERNKVVEARAKKLGIPLLKGVDDKKDALLSYCRENRISPADVVYIGNDLNDLDVMSVVGYPACPSDACAEVKSISGFIFRAAGGDGVVRELWGLLENHLESVGGGKWVIR